MSRKDKWCDMAKSELLVELNMSEDLRITDLKKYWFWNGLLTCLVISLALLAATKCYHLAL